MNHYFDHSERIFEVSYNWVTCSGEGKFGRVVLVKCKKTGEYGALKILAADCIIHRRHLVDHVCNERKLMCTMDHPFIIKLWVYHTLYFYSVFTCETPYELCYFAIFPRSSEKYDRDRNRNACSCSHFTPTAWSGHIGRLWITDSWHTMENKCKNCCFMWCVIL